MAPTQFYLYLFVAVLIQASLLLFIRKQGIGTQHLYLLTISYILQNAIFLGIHFISYENVIAIEILVRFFYALSFLSIAYFLSHAIEVCTVKPGGLTQQIENGVWIVALCGAILSIVTDEIITGFRYLLFTVTADQGEIFWIRLTHAILAMLTASVILIKEWVDQTDHTKKKHCLCLIIAYASFALFAVIVTMMMRYGVQISFALAFPFFSTFALCLITYGNFRYGWLTTPINNAPEQLEISEKSQLDNIFTNYTDGKYSFNEASEKIDLLLLMHAYNKHDGNMMKTAEAMGLGRSTLYKKVQKHKLR